MAVIKKDGGNMALPIAIKRGNPIALDTTSVWYNKTEMETYAKSGATAYVGQYLVFVNEEHTETNEETKKTITVPCTAEAYVIANPTGTLIKLASTTSSGDLAADVIALQGKVSALETALAGVKKTADGAMPKSGGEFSGAIILPIDAPTEDAQAANKKYVDDSIGKLTGIEFKIVESLPETGKTGVIYLVAHNNEDGNPAHNPSDKDIYDEYIWVTDKFEKIGNTDIDLSAYAKSTDVDTKISTEIGKLDVDEITVGAGKTISKISETDGKIAVTPVDIQIAESQVTGLTEALADKQAASDNLDKFNALTGDGGLVRKKADGTYESDKTAYLVSTDLSDYAKTADVDSKIEATDAKVTANTTAIETINNTESGILAQAKKYTDDNKYNDTTIKADVEANKTAIDAINNKTTGILAQAKKYTDDNKYDDTTIKASVKANTDAIAAINNEETGILKTAKDYADGKASANKTLIDALDARVVANTEALGSKASTTALEAVKKTADENAKTIALILDDPSTEAIDSIKELTKYVEEDGKTTAGLVSRLAGIGGEGEPATVLEAIQQAEYELTVATTEKLGGVKSAAANKENAVQVGADGVMSIAKITTDILAQGEQELILNGGSAAL